MICPKCMNSVSALSSRCAYCTENYGTGNLWASNIMAWVLIIGFFMLLSIVL